MLAHRYGDPVAGGRVIDLFAGTGALGLEALSRGAAHALFVEEGAEARALIRDNVEALGVAGLCRIFRRDATKLGDVQAAPFDLAFLDPLMVRASARPRWPRCAMVTGSPGALCVLEEAAAAPIARRRASTWSSGARPASPNWCSCGPEARLNPDAAPCLTLGTERPKARRA